MKIVALTAENVKKLVAVEIRPDGNLVEITGKNGQGKTSVLDAIWWCLAGADHIQRVPIRKGANEARIKLDLGDIIVTRKFRTKEDGEITTAIVVENLDGARFPSPQRMLDGLLGALTFDPLAFSRMSPREQFDTLRMFAPDVDFDGIENRQRGDFERRADINRQFKEKRGAAAVIELPDDCPTERRDETALIDELQKAGDHNAAIEKRKAAREQAQRDANEKKNSAVALRERSAKLREEANRLDGEASALLDAAAAIEKKIDEAEALPKPIDTDAIRDKITSARDHNELVTRHAQRERLQKEADALEAQSVALTDAMSAREEEKRQAIAAAKLPVEGLGFGDGVILMNGVPFDQASDAEQLRVSIAIAMASNPKLRVIRVRDGSLLDEDAMKILGEMADANDYQIWVERVDSSGRIGFVLEDGMIKGQKLEAAE